jgi:FKBP-type peptidyl-prolyl cis-trans isomerase FkpA
MSRFRFLALALLTIGFSACLNSTAPEYATVENTEFAQSLGVDLSASTKTEVGVYYRDIVVGTGPVIAPLQDSYMFYHAYLSNGTEFDKHLPPTPAHFTTGQGTLIPGFEIGLEGMRVGGRRQIIVPPAVGYGLGDYQVGNVVIPGNSVLVFDVTLTDAAGGNGTTTP